MYTTRDIMLMVELANHLASRGARWNNVDAFALVVCRPNPGRSAHEFGLMVELFGIRHDYPTTDEVARLIRELDNFCVDSNVAVELYDAFIDAIWGNSPTTGETTTVVNGYAVAYPREEA